MFFKCIGTFTKIDHMLGHKKCFNKIERNEIVQSTFSNHNRIKLEISYGKILMFSNI